MQSSIDKMYCLNSINNINSNLLVDHKFNLIKSEMYPDPYSHMTVTCLEYPESKDNKAMNSNSTEKQKELSKAQSRAKRFSRRNNIRYMTQPVTLIEIKEMEEDSLALNSTHSKSNHSKEN